MKEMYAQCIMALGTIAAGLFGGTLLKKTRFSDRILPASCGALFGICCLLWLPAALRLASAVITLPALILGLIVGTFIKENHYNGRLPAYACALLCFTYGIALLDGLLPSTYIGMLIFVPIGVLCNIKTIFLALPFLPAGMLVGCFLSFPSPAGIGLLLSLANGMILQCLAFSPAVLCGWVCAITLILL